MQADAQVGVRRNGRSQFLVVGLQGGKKHSKNQFSEPILDDI